MPVDRVHTAGEMHVRWGAELPKETQHKGQACSDPAIEAALSALSQTTFVYLWGEDKEPAIVHFEICEEDVFLEEDDRQ